MRKRTNVIGYHLKISGTVAILFVTALFEYSLPFIETWFLLISISYNYLTLGVIVLKIIAVVSVVPGRIEQ